MTQAPDGNGQAGKAAHPGARPPELREMFAEISSLLASLAKALDLTEADAAAALERGEITLRLDRDANNNPYVAVTAGTTTARIYQGAIKRGQG